MADAQAAPTRSGRRSPTRGFPVVPLGEAVEVVKVPTPDMDGQGIGGTINAVLASPFDHVLAPTAVLSVRAGYDELNASEVRARTWAFDR